MKSTGIVRQVDSAGRIVIPKEIRKQLGVVEEVDGFEIFTEGDFIILKKYQPSCIFCGRLGDSIDYNGNTVCYECIEKMREMKSE